MNRTILSLLFISFLWPASSMAQLNWENDFEQIEEKVIDWRRHIHQNPELSNREFNTAKMIAEHLRSLGLEVQTGVAKTGVVGLLKGGKPGKVVALRADIDALPVTERNDLAFKSEVTTEFLGQSTGVMHACGHDTHTAILMGMDRWPGDVVNRRGLHWRQWANPGSAVEVGFCRNFAPV